MEIGVFLIFSLKNTYKPDPIIINIPTKVLKLDTSPNASHPNKIDQKINVYSKGAIVGGEANGKVGKASTQGRIGRLLATH